MAVGAAMGITLRVCQTLDEAMRNSAVGTFKALGEASESYKVQRDLAASAIGPELCVELDKSGIARATQTLKNGRVDERRGAALLFGACDQAAQKAARDLEKAMSDSDPLVRHHVAYALRRIAASEPWVIAALQRVASTDPDEQVRAIAREAVSHGDQ
jgi:hypothetical protein